MLIVSTILLVLAILITISLIVQIVTSLINKHARDITIQSWAMAIIWGAFYYIAHLL